MVGVGSAVFHPEASRVARAASGGRHGFAQSLFQVGGNFGQSLGPLLAAFIVVPFGQHSVLAFTVLALAAVVLLTGVSRWYAAHRAERRQGRGDAGPAHPRTVVVRTLVVLIVMLFSKVVYLASINSYYTFYLIQTFGVSIQNAQVLLFVFLAAVAAGTFLGGPLVDRFGAKYVIWGSILGVLPFTLLLPHLGLLGTVINSIAIGLIISSAFSAMIVYAQELTPGNVGAVAGLFFGLSFGLGGVGAALLGMLADETSLTFVYQVRIRSGFTAPASSSSAASRSAPKHSTGTTKREERRMEGKFIPEREIEMQGLDWGRLGWVSSPVHNGAAQLAIVVGDRTRARGTAFTNIPARKR